ncbi:MAG: DUF2793 domain-containing protein [Hyphomicrobium sp.]
MDLTPNLGLPYIMAAQSQKHVTHNEAIRALDAIVQLSVLDRGLGTPPASPAEGARYIVGSSPTGAWSGHAHHVAAYQDGAWMLYTPLEGWIAWIADENIAVVWTGSAWSALTTGEGGGWRRSRSRLRYGRHQRRNGRRDQPAFAQRPGDALQPRRRRSPPHGQQSCGRRHGKPALSDRLLRPRRARPRRR